MYYHLTMSKVPLMGYRCQRCGHEWLPRKNSKNEPKVCPKCKSPYWNRPRISKKKEGGSVSNAKN